jgi:hypothetical protein
MVTFRPRITTLWATVILRVIHRLTSSFLLSWSLVFCIDGWFKNWGRVGVALFMYFLSVAVDSLDDMKFRAVRGCIYEINYL